MASLIGIDIRRRSQRPYPPNRVLTQWPLPKYLSLSMKEIEPFLRAGGDAAEMKFMECCRYLWKADGVELIEPFIEAVFNKLPEKSRCVLFQRILTIVDLAQDGEQIPTPPE